MALDFGLIYEITVPKPHPPGKEQEYINALIDQVVLADELGYSHVWHVEHHFLTEYSHSSAPDALLGAYAARTKNIRIGMGVKLLPFNYNHPLRAAEEAAMLDLVSNGRLEFGTGRSGSTIEMLGFGIEPRETRAQWEESLRMIVKAWRDEEFSWDSPNFKLPPRNVLPKPAQRPHPPIWMACTGPDSHAVAGELGLGCLSFVLMIELEELARRIQIYRNALKRAKPIGDFVNDQVAAFTIAHCAETDEEARATAANSQVWFVKKSLEYVSALAAYMEGKTDPTLSYLNEMKGFDPRNLNFEYMDSRAMCVVGSPKTCIEKIRKYEEIGLTQVIMDHQTYGVPLDKVKKSIELMGKYVIPAFR